MASIEIPPVDRLLFSVPPNLPLRQGQRVEDMEAAVMLQRYSYDDTAAFIPGPLKGTVPPVFKTNNRLLLRKNEPGFVFNKNQHGWAAMLIVRVPNKHIIAWIPLTYVRLGEKWKSLLAQVQKTLPNPQPALLQQPTPVGPVFDRFVRALWRGIASQSDALHQLQLSTDRFKGIFDNDFHQRVEDLLAGFIPEVRQMFNEEQAHAQQLLRIPPVTRENPGAGSCVYARTYTRPSDERDRLALSKPVNGVYVGQSNNTWLRKERHEHDLDGNDITRHFVIARKSHPNNRHMCPVWYTSRNAPDALVDMVEETVALALNTYHASLFGDNYGKATPPRELLLRRRAQFLTGIADQARAATGWPTLAHRGCNVLSPLFTGSGASRAGAVLCIPSPKILDDQVRTFTTYRMPIHFHRAGKRQGLRSSFFIRSVEDRKNIEYNVSISGDTVNKLGFPDKMHGYLVMEVMDDGGYHPQAYVGVPSIACFEDFIRASSLGMRFEYFDEPIKKWCSIPIQATLLFTSSAADMINEGDLTGLLENYWRMMRLIQALENVTYTGELNGHERAATFTSRETLVVSVDHLQQTCTLSQQEVITKPAPKPTNFNDNHARMREEFSSEHTHVGLVDPIVPGDDILAATNTKTERVDACDTCRIMSVKDMKIPCERDMSFIDIWICKLCALLKRPCTKTRLEDVLRPEVYGKRFHERGVVAKGKLRRLIWHHTLSEDELATKQIVGEPIERRLFSDVELELETEN